MSAADDNNQLDSIELHEPFATLSQEHGYVVSDIRKRRLLQQKQKFFEESLEVVRRSFQSDDILKQYDDFSIKLHNLVNNHDTLTKINSIKDFVAGYSKILSENNETISLKLQGSLSEMYTFSDSSDMDVCLVHSYDGFQVDIVPNLNPLSSEKGEFQLNITYGKRRLFKSVFPYLFGLFFAACLILLLFFCILTFARFPYVTFSSSNIAWIVIINFALNILITCAFLAIHYFSHQHQCCYRCRRGRIACGPAFTIFQYKLGSNDDYLKLAVDIVPYVYCSEDHHDELLQEWRHRQRKLSNYEIFEDCHLGMLMTDFRENKWRWSFSEFECKYIRNLPLEQALVLLLFKKLTKSTIPNSKISYAVKTSFFWFLYFCHNDATVEWIPKNAILNTFFIFTFFRRCISAKCLWNYFYLKENVFLRCGVESSKIPTIMNLADVKSVNQMYGLDEDVTSVDLMFSLNRIVKVKELIERDYDNGKSWFQMDDKVDGCLVKDKEKSLSFWNYREKQIRMIVKANSWWWGGSIIATLFGLLILLVLLWRFQFVIINETYEQIIVGIGIYSLCAICLLFVAYVYFILSTFYCTKCHIPWKRSNHGFV